MNFEESKLEQLTSDIWNSTVGSTATRTAAFLPSATRESNVTTCVQVMGSWIGAVIVECQPELARQLASDLHGVPCSKVSFAQIRDVLGEVTNILAGQIKTMISGESHLSLPIVVTGFDYHLMIPGSKPVNRLAFESGENMFQLSLAELDEAVYGTAFAGG